MDSAIPVEVERKFVIPDDIEERLSSLNAQHTKNITFTDEYLDTKDNRLALSGNGFHANGIQMIIR